MESSHPSDPPEAGEPTPPYPGGLGLPRPSLDDFATVDWQDAVAEAPFRRLHEYAGRFADRAGESATGGETRATSVFQSLADVCSLVLRSDQPGDPYGPWMVTAAFRTASLEDLSDETVQACGALAAGTRDPQLRARLADVAWVRARDFPAAQVAIASYLTLAESVTPDDWPDPFDYLERATNIAAELGRHSDELRRVKEFIDSRLDRFAPTDDGFLSAQLMSLLVRFGVGEAVQHAMTAAGLARRALEAKAFHRARTYWALAARWAGQAKNLEQRQAFLVQVGETYVAEADEALPRPVVGRLQAANYLQQAIEALRRAGGVRPRIEELHTRLVRIQAEAVSDIPVYSQSADITSFVEAAERAVAGKALDEALVTFARYPEIPAVAHTRETAERHAREFLFKRFFPAQYASTSGKVIARQASVASDDRIEREAALRVDMFALARQYQEMIAQAVIEPMRRQVIREHGVTLRHLMPILEQNPLVVGGREGLFAEGLVAGFYGDLVHATHVLVPQLEHSIRMLLYRSGERVSGLDSEGIQGEYGLNGLLYSPALPGILGEDLVFAFQGLLVAKPGSDIRNRMAHGLMTYGEFFSSDVSYLWWLTFRLCMLPLLIRLSKEAAAAPDVGVEPAVPSAEEPPNSGDDPRTEA